MSNSEPGCWVIQSLWRYPVKSMQGEALQSAELGDRGLRGDRAYAIRDAATGDICSAKHPRKWAKLLACRASFVEEPRPDGRLPAVRITLPDGAEIRSDEPDADARLSEAVGRPVALISGAPSQLW